MTSAPHRKLGTAHGLAQHRTIYLTDEFVEVEAAQSIDLVCTRVFLDDVMRVTIHRRQPVAHLVLVSCCTAIVLGIAAVLLALPDAAQVAPWVALLSLPFVGGLAILVVVKLTVVTVVGRRSKAEIHFVLGRQKARRCYETIVAAVRGRLAQPEAEGPVPPPEPPPLPAA